MKTSKILVPVATIGLNLVLACMLCAQVQCMVPSNAGNEFHPVWGGESWATFSQTVDGSLYIWIGEDGGRLRTSSDGGASWVFADTPDDFTGSIFDIWFFPDSLHGFAVGRGGRVLETIDGGTSYHYYGVPVTDAGNELASIWGIRALSPSKVIVSGLWSFKITDNSGQSWQDIQIYDSHPSTPNSNMISIHDMELFRLDLIGEDDDFVGSVGATWEEAVDHGVVLFTDANDPASNSGTNWWIVLDDLDFPVNVNTGAKLAQPWSVRFEQGTTDQQTALGYIVGNRGGTNSGNFPSRVYRTEDSGRSWVFDSEQPVALYDVTFNSSGKGLFVGYSGTWATRNPVNGNWNAQVMPSPSTYPTTPGFSTGALLASAIFGEDGLIAVGDFGSQRISYDYGQTWSSMSTFYPNSDEIEQRIGDCAFVESKPDTGCMVGQFGRILRTENGGCDWDLVADMGGTFTAVDMDDNGRGLAVGNNKFAFSTDYGVNWQIGKWAAGTCFTGFDCTDPNYDPNNGPNVQFSSVSLTGDTEGWAVGRLGGRPIVAYTRSRGREWFLIPGPLPGNLRLTGVSMANPTEGLVVGNRFSSGQPIAKAYRMDVTSSSVNWTDVTPTGIAVGRSFEDVAVSPGPLDAARAVAVGNSALVAEWSTSLLEFEVRTTPINRDVDYFSVDVSPSGAIALAGGSYDEDLTYAATKGFMLRLTPTTAEEIRAFTGKDIVGISLTSDGYGYVAGQATTGSSSFIHGNLASSILLRYIEE